MLGMALNWLLATLLAVTVQPAHAAPKAKAKPAAKAAAGPITPVAHPLGNPNAPQGGTFAINLKGEPTTLNPITSADLYGSQVQSYIIENLLNQNIDTLEWEPGLAEKYEVSPDGKQYTFTVRKNAKWTDGQPVTVDDVKYSYDVIMGNDYATAHLKPYYENIEKVEILDPQTIRFTAKEKYFQTLSTIAALKIVPKHIYSNAAEGKKMNKSLIGSGAYKIEKYDQGQSILLERNKDWWGNNEPQFKGSNNFDHIRLRFIADSNIIIESLKKGDLHYGELTPEEYTKKTSDPEWGKTVIKVKAENHSPKTMGFIGWNERRDLFKDKTVRKALAELMNRDEMNQKFRFGMSLPATGPWYQQNEAADRSVKAVPYNPKDAVKILNAAGWTDSDKDGLLDKVINGQKTNFSFTLFYGNKDTEKYWVLYQSDLRKVGIEMKLQLLEWNAMTKNIDEGKFDAVAMGWAGVLEEDPKQIWHSSSAVRGGSNFIGYMNPEVDKLIDEARQELDKPKRTKLFQTVYRKIAEDYPYALLFNDKYDLYARGAKIGSVKPTYKFDVGTSYWWMTAQ